MRIEQYPLNSNNKWIYFSINIIISHLITCYSSPQPSAIEDLRKWTSIEAIGDVTVTPDCLSRVNMTANGSLLNTTVFSSGDSTAHRDNSGTLLSITPPSPLSPSSNDETDIVTVISNSYSRQPLLTQPDTSVPLDHRLPSPEEQSLTLAAKWVSIEFVQEACRQ